MAGHLAVLAATASPSAGSASTDITGLLLGYGPLGLIALVLGWLLLKRWRFVSPAEETEIRKTARDEGRADLTAELQRADARAERAEARAIRAEEKYDAVVDDLKPLLASFVTVTGTLNPILQDIVRFGLPAARNRRRESE